MVNLYHLSHFFEFLTGMYFGGLAFLEFLQNKASLPFTKLLEKRQQSSTDAKTQVVEYYTIRVTAANGALKAISNSFKWGWWCFINTPANWAFNKTHSYIAALVKNQGDFMRRHFPVFFFTGCFCLVIVLFSGLEQAALEHKKLPIFDIAYLDRFFTLYCASAVIFQFWGVFVFPRLVASRDYLVLIILNFAICLALIFLTYRFSSSQTGPFGLYHLINPANTEKFIVTIITISLFPLFSIMIVSATVLTLFTGTTYFYNKTLKSYKKKVLIIDTLQKLGENLNQDKNLGNDPEDGILG